MVRDNRRIAAPDNCTSVNVFKPKEALGEILNKDGQRKDARTPEDIKSMSLRVGIVPSVTGSAYLERGNTKVICSVIGPRDVLNKTDSSTKGQLYCEFKYAMFSCKERQSYMPSEEEAIIAKSIQDALEPVVLLHKFPKSRLDIFIYVLENDGGAISASITCAGAALSNAGVEMYDLPVGCSLVYCDSQFLIDPTAREENYKEKEDFMKISMAMMVEYKSQVIFMDSLGRVNPSLLTQSMQLLQSACQLIATDVKFCLKQHVQEIHRKAQDGPPEGTLNKKVSEAKLFQPYKYMKTFLENNIRTDGRSVAEFRPLLIDFSPVRTADGSALVKMGETSVLCGIKAELANPLHEQPDKGFLVPNVTLTPICSNRYAPGPPTEQAQVYSQMILELWQNFPFLDPCELCIVPDKLSWCLFADMVCLSHDGNVLDACVLALMAALRNLQLPKVSITEGEIQISDEKEDLKMGSFAFSATYSVLEDSVVADPSAEEESLSDSSVTVFINNNMETSIHSFGPIKEDQLHHCIDSSKKRLLNVKRYLERRDLQI